MASKSYRWTSKLYGRINRILIYGSRILLERPSTYDFLILEALYMNGVDVRAADELRCPICGKVFRSRNALKAHMRGHKQFISMLVRQIA